MRQGQKQPDEQVKPGEGEIMLPETKWRQFGLPNMEVKGIVVHNTNAPNMTAKDLLKYMSETNTSKGAHYFVDEEKTVQAMPEDWSCFNTGQGYDFGNTSCISIEICTKGYEKAEERAVKLIKKLLKKYHLTTDDIYFHRDLDRTVNCPAQTLKKYGTKNEFIRRNF